MKTTEFNKSITSSQLQENLEKQFGSRVNLEKYDREQLEDIRNKLRTRIFQQEGSAGINDLLTNETYQKDKAMLELLNTRIKEMLGEDIKKLRDKMDQLSEAKKGVKAPKYTKKAAGSKPDFPDIDNDGNKKEKMKDAAADKKAGPQKGVNPFAKKDTKMKEATRIGTVTPARDQYGDKIPGARPTVELPTSQAQRNQLAMQAKANRGAGNLKGAGTQATVPGGPGGADFKIAAVNTNKSYQDGHNSPEVNITPGSKHAGADQQARQKRIDLDMKYGHYEGIKKDRKELEGNKFGKAVRDAKADGVQKGEKIKVGGKEYSVKEGFPTVDDAKKNAQGTAGMKPGEKKKSSTGGEVTKTATGLKHTAGKNYGGKDAPKAPDSDKKVKKSMKESAFKHNVRFVNESLQFLLAEDEEGKAKAITAAGDIVNDYTSWMQRVGQYQTKTMIELADAIKADFGAAEAEQFKQAVGPALSATLEVLTQQREAVSGAVATLAGEATPEEPMGMEPGMDQGMDMPPEPGMDAAGPDAMNPDMGDEFGAADAAAGGPEASGRAMRESKFARRLSESHSIMSKLAK